MKTSFLLIGFFLFIGLIGGVSAVGTYPAVDPSMVLYYHFNNQSAFQENDTFVHDFSNGAINNGSVLNSVNVTFSNSSGYDGWGAFTFNGLGSIFFNKVQVNTACFWIKPKGSGERNILFNSIDAESHFDIRSNGNYAIFSGGTFLDSGIPAVNDVWQYVCYSYNGSGYDFYYNGAKRSSIAKSLLNMTRISRTSGAYLNGTIDELIILNRTLSQSEIWLNYVNYLSGCLNITENLYIGGDTNFCKDNYQFNDSGTDGVIIINTSNVYLNFNGSELNGTNVVNSIGLNLFADNITVYNLTISNFNKEIKSINNKNIIVSKISCYNPSLRCIHAQNVSNLSVTDSLFINRTTYMFEVINSTHLYFLRNSFFTSNMIFLSGNNQNMFILNNSINKGTSSANSIIYQGEGNNSNYLIKGNNFLNGGVNQNIGFEFGNFTNVTIEDNLFFNSTGLNNKIGEFIKLANVSGDFSIKNNLFNISSSFIVLSNSLAFVNILNNSFENSYLNGDSYNTGVQISKSENIKIEGNTFNTISCAGILTQGVNNLSIVENEFLFNLLFNIAKNGNCQNEIPSAIDLASNWKGWLSDGSELSSDNVTKLLTYSARNVNISGNTFEGYSVLLRASAPINLSQDLIGYKFESFSFPNYLMPRQDYYLSNSFLRVNTSYGETFLSNVVSSDILGAGYKIDLINNASKGLMTNYKLDKDFLFLKNINDTQNYTAEIFNKTNFLAFNTNLSIYGSSRISNNNGEINITLPARNSSYVLNNYNITKDLVRANDPIFNGTFLNQTLIDTVTIPSYVNTFSNGRIKNGSILTNKQELTLSQGSYGTALA